MQFKAKIGLFVFILLIGSIVLGGCNYLSSNPTKREELNEDYRVGVKGLVISFPSNYPPAQLYDDEPFNVIVEVHNQGAKNIKAGSNSKIYLSGFDDGIIHGIENNGKIVGDLEGKSLYNLEGDKTSVEFKGTISSLSARGMSRYDFNLMATACFAYNTIYEGSVCIDSDPFSRTSRNKPCTPVNPSAGSQGAPIAVSNIVLEAQPKKTRFKIYVENVGEGTVFRPGYEYLEKCSPANSQGLEYGDTDYVLVKSVKVSDLDITGTCKPLRNSLMKLDDGRGYIICEMPTAGPAYTAPLRIDLEYGYRDSISKNIEIISTDKY
jgi:hypothetical protein